MQCDVEAVRRRYERELAPPLVSGSRALVDSGALLWRCHVTGTWEGALPSAAVCALGARRVAAQPAHARSPRCTAALGLATEGDDVGLAALRTIAHAHHDPAFRDVVAPLCGGAAQVVEGEFADAADRLDRRAPPHRRARWQRAPSARCSRTRSCYALARSGQGERAAEVLDQRLSRRTSPLDARRRAALMPATVDGSGTAT